MNEMVFVSMGLILKEYLQYNKPCFFLRTAVLMGSGREKFGRFLKIDNDCQKKRQQNRGRFRIRWTKIASYLFVFFK